MRGKNIKLTDPRISILINGEGTTIEVYDTKSSLQIMEIKLTPEQLSQALGRLGHTKCEVILSGIENVDKTHENEYFTFEIPEELERNAKGALNQKCLKALKEAGKEDWTPDNNYNSQNSFSRKEGKFYATSIIRRWV